jgi:hypothetical protein
MQESINMMSSMWFSSHVSCHRPPFRAMALFSSWRDILRRLAGLDFHYAAIGIFGKTAVHKTLKASSAYLQEANVQ